MIMKFRKGWRYTLRDGGYPSESPVTTRETKVLGGGRMYMFTYMQKCGSIGV